MRFDWVWRRPAVSMIATSLAARTRAASTASKATAAGSAPALPPTKSAFARSAQISSCSSAAPGRCRPRRGAPSAVLAELLRQLADRRRLAGAVDAHDEDDARAAVERERGGSPKSSAISSASAAVQVGDLAACLEPPYELGGRPHAHVPRR